MQTVKSYVKNSPAIYGLYKFLQRLVNPGYPLSIRLKLYQKKLFQLIDYPVDRGKLMVNIGGGINHQRHWRVLDVPNPHYQYPASIIDYVFDLTSGKPLPFEDNSVAFFYSSHTFEHIPQTHCPFLFSEIYRCLKPGGAFRMQVPDFDKGYDAYLRGDREYFRHYPADTLEDSLLDYFATSLQGKIVPEQVAQGIKTMEKIAFADDYIGKISLEDHHKNPGQHTNWWNFDKFAAMAKAAGFTEFYRSEAQGSRFTEMRGAGGRHHGFDSRHPEICLFAETIK
ncbi:MAG TPA: methyltransferase domain-containing protein [Aggregatilineales bacterium]|nr:methyltransferase domain-containing protein [Aggregatilineales bacterium]